MNEKCDNCMHFDKSKLTVLKVGKCTRFPQAVEKQSFEFCGEYKEYVKR